MAQYVIKVMPIRDVTPGMELGRILLSDDKKIMLSEGTVLTVQLLNRIKSWHIFSLAIRLQTSTVPVANVLTVENHVNEEQKKFFRTYHEAVINLKKCFNTMRYFAKIPMEQMQDISRMAIESLANSRGVINNLLMIRHKDDYTYQHSVNVAVLTGLLGKWLGYKESELRKLILSGLLHDIGKSQVPLEILNKPGVLTKEEKITMNLHPVLGYQLIKNDKDLADDIKTAVLQHHERMDGKGYPIGLSRDKIQPFARIIAVADIYDAMTSDRVYRRKVTPYKVVEVLLNEMFATVDPVVCTTFLNNVRDYFLGNIVELSDGRIGKVVYLWNFSGAMPVVRTTDGEFIDLEKNRDIAIIKLVKG